MMGVNDVITKLSRFDRLSNEQRSSFSQQQRFDLPSLFGGTMIFIVIVTLFELTAYVFAAQTDQLVSPGDLFVLSDPFSFLDSSISDASADNIFPDFIESEQSDDNAPYADFIDISFDPNTGGDDLSPIFADSDRGCFLETSRLPIDLRPRNEVCGTPDDSSDTNAIPIDKVLPYINLATLELKEICPSGPFVPFGVAVCSSGRKGQGDIFLWPLEATQHYIPAYFLNRARRSKLAFNELRCKLRRR